jgi:excisionase family DNA binding protein
MTAPALQLGFGLEELAEAIRGKLFMTVPEVANLARVDQRTLRRAIEDGQLAAVRIGNTTRIPTAALLRLAAIEGAGVEWAQKLWGRPHRRTGPEIQSPPSNSTTPLSHPTPTKSRSNSAGAAKPRSACRRSLTAGVIRGTCIHATEPRDDRR